MRVRKADRSLLKRSLKDLLLIAPPFLAAALVAMLARSRNVSAAAFIVVGVIVAIAFLIQSRRYRTFPCPDCKTVLTRTREKEDRPITFVCAACGQPLFESKTKFESGTGWPSFNDPAPGAIETTEDTSYGMQRIEVHCSRCGGHLGHVFPDGPPPSGLRYCINGVATNFQPKAGAA